MEQRLPTGDEAAWLCFPSQNSSCTADIQVEYLFVIAFISILLSVFTVFGNLLVIISICVFKHHRSPASILTLALAVTDLLFGAILMPLESVRLIQSCWHFGVTMCSVFNMFFFVLSSMSLCNIVLIAINRYFAVCDPLQYNSKMSINRTVRYILLGWGISLLYNLLLTNVNIYNQDIQYICNGECMTTSIINWGPIDLLITFVFPCTIIFTLYARIFKVALKHSNEISSSTQCNRQKKGLRIYERKATKTLGIVVFVYLACWIPWYISLLNMEKMSNPYLVWKSVTYLFYCNSCLNPFIYAFFYPGFKKSAKLILTLRIIKSSSIQLNALPDNQ